jgi:hypothetical protein
MPRAGSLVELDDQIRGLKQPKSLQVPKSPSHKNTFKKTNQSLKSHFFSNFHNFFCPHIQLLMKDGWNTEMENWPKFHSPISTLLTQQKAKMAIPYCGIQKPISFISFPMISLKFKLLVSDHCVLQINHLPRFVRQNLVVVVVMVIALIHNVLVTPDGPQQIIVAVERPVS